MLNCLIDENIRIHGLWSAIRALRNNIVGVSMPKAFREELRYNAAAKEDLGASVVLDSLESTGISDIVQPLADLATWFANEVAPKVSQVALVPDENAGVLSYLVGKTLSGIRLKR